ncbi:hypothetical protein SORBI_3002G385000 [Sorghum bicolor]|uniref:Uncharacterized protein n=1 Tax=Sorghum bicolor TaxID=4558 RepID=A0A1W0W7J3_SORBI|nr:hypothetical protein SORBI_3002G385000 [Sorghum bicolor]
MNTSGWPLHRLSSGRLGLSPGKDGLANKSRSPDRTPTPVFPSLATSQTSRENPKKPSEAFFLSSDPKLSSPVKMARPPPAGAISARARPVILSGLWHSRQRKGRAFSYMRNLIAVLNTVAPHVLEDPHFLERCLLLDGVPASVSPCDLIQSILGVQTAVLVRDSQTGFRIGLLVFFDAIDSAAATIQTPREGLYATCTPATWHDEEVSRSYILDGVADEFVRRCTARMLRSLLPSQYILADEDGEFHLRCVLIGAGRSPISEGAYGLCDLAWKVLFARGYVVAAIVHRDRQAGVLVYDDTESTALVARRAPHLLKKRGLQLFDSSLFPLLADPADRDATLLRRLLPQCVIDDDESYRRRVLLFTGLDTQKLDAADLAHFLRFETDLVHTVEAVIIHRSEGLIVVVLGSSEDTMCLLQTPEETWIRFFGQKPSFASAFGFESASSDISPEQQSDRMEARYWMETAAFQRVRDWMSDQEARLSDGDTIGILHCLIRSCTLVSPDSVLRGDFPERSLLLSGVVEGTSCFDLSVRLSVFGDLYNVALDKSGLALAVFRCWHSAARLLREPQNTWAGLGFVECSRVPDAHHAGVIAQDVMAQLLQ